MQAGSDGAHDLLARAERYFDDRQGIKESVAKALDELRYVRRLVDRIDVKLEEEAS